MNDPGVQGLAQLGRNAIDRVSELERGVAERDETIAALTLRAEQAERAVGLAEGELAKLRAELSKQFTGGEVQKITNVTHRRRRFRPC